MRPHERGNKTDQALYADRGFVLCSRVVDPVSIDLLLGQFVGLVNQLSGEKFEHAGSPDLATFLTNHKLLQGRAYDEMRRPDWLTEFSKQPGIVKKVQELLGLEIALQRKIVFRIDTPRATDELAVWHQDHYYVRGNVSIVTAWIPLQDTPFELGCLAVMPKSHELGPLEHDVSVLGKRHYPSGVFDREVRFVEMKKGDMLLFHSCLLHSSSVNLSSMNRYSVQARFTRVGEPTDPGMGGILPL